MKVVAGLLFFVALMSNAFGQSSTKQVSVLYDTDISFSYLTPSAVSRSDIDRSSDSSNSSNQADEPSPTLGMRKALFGIEWRLPRSVNFTVGLRPDAGPSGNATELDTRAGRVLESAASVKLLDQYSVSYKIQSSLVSMGVENRLIEPERLSGEELDFGLRPRGPEKAFAVTCDAAHLLESSGGGGLSLTLKATGGRDERNDSRHHASGGVGDTPAKKDPYWGGLVQTSLLLNDDMRFGFAVAFLEERQSGIKVKNSIYQIGVRRNIEIENSRRLTLALEGRQLRQTFDKTGLSMAAQSLSSIGITSVFGRKSGEGVVLGIWTGTGDLHANGNVARSFVSKGHQISAGWQWMMEDVLKVSAVVARDLRIDHDSDGRQIGGFKTSEGYESSITRLALSVNYVLSGQL
jgi:hypothetical protein